MTNATTGTLTLSARWGLRAKLRADGSKLRADGSKLWAEGDKLRAEGDRLWAEAILETFGNIRLEWVCREGDYDCELENGETYRHDQKEG